MSGTLHQTSRVLHLLGPESVEIRSAELAPPAAGEFLLRIDRATTCGTDLKVFLRGGHPTMLQVPCPFGHEMTGTVAATGHGVSAFQAGDQVVVANSAACGSCARCREGRANLCEDLHYLNGAFAEYILVPRRFVERSTYRRPPQLPPQVATLAEPLACVLHGLSAVRGVADQEVLVLGGGPIGLMFVIELAARGARVTLADMVTERLAAGRRLGAAAMVELDDAGRGLQRCAAGASLVIEATGTAAGWQSAIEAVRPGGEVLLFGGCPPGTPVSCDAHRLHYSEITVRGVYHHRPATFTAALQRLVENPSSYASLVDEEHPLEGVETALRRMAERRILKAAINPWLQP